MKEYPYLVLLKYQCRIIFSSPYKMACAILLTLALPFITGVSNFDFIGRSLDRTLAIPMIILCSDVYCIELTHYTADNLYCAIRSKMGLIMQRFFLFFILMLILSPIVFAMFLWNHPMKPVKGIYLEHILQSAFAIPCTLFFYGVFSMTVSNIFKSYWAGLIISISSVVMLFGSISDKNEIWSIFSFTYRHPIWPWSKVLYVVLGIILIYLNKWLVNRSPYEII